MTEILSQHFALKEFIRSTTADYHKIDNTPPLSAVIALTTLVHKTLQPLRIAVNKPIRINSGYRCEELNRLVKGSTKSQHLRGEAADIAIDGDAIRIIESLLSEGIPFDQCILYTRRNFVHISYFRLGGNRHKLIYQ